MAIVSLVLGFLCLLLMTMPRFWALILILTIVCGHSAREHIRKSKGKFFGGIIALIGLTLGYSSIVIMLFAPMGPPHVDMLRAQGWQAVNNARQIYLATFQMATDAAVVDSPSIGWPSDIEDPIKLKNISDFVNVLVIHGYLNPGDLKIFSAAGIKPYPGIDKLDPPFTEKYNAFKVYLVKESDPGDTIFLATKNFTYGKPLDPKVKPFGDKLAVICFKSGDCRLIKAGHAQNLELIGKLPGGGAEENTKNCLNLSAPLP